jgi:hypothetical protein
MMSLQRYHNCHLFEFLVALDRFSSVLLAEKKLQTNLGRIVTQKTIDQLVTCSKIIMANLVKKPDVSLKDSYKDQLDYLNTVFVSPSSNYLCDDLKNDCKLVWEAKIAFSDRIQCTLLHDIFGNTFFLGMKGKLYTPPDMPVSYLRSCPRIRLCV